MRPKKKAPPERGLGLESLRFRAGLSFCSFIWASVNYFTLGGEKICEPYRQARWGMHMLAWIITVVVAIGLIWSFVAMSELLPVASDSVAISRPAK
jgi:hypothetical protein